MSGKRRKNLPVRMEARQRLGQLTAETRDNVKHIAQAFAGHRRGEAVDVRDIEEAFHALARNGLKLHAWWKRPEAEVGFGGLLMGASIRFLVGPPSTLTFGVALVLVLFGGLCWLHGWWRHML